MSVYSSRQLLNTIGLCQNQRPLEIKTEHGTFYIGEGAHDYGRPVENLDFERLAGAPEMRALLYGSLTRYQQHYGPITAPVLMMAGLPLQMLSGEMAREYANQVRQWLKGSHAWQADGQEQQIEITEIKLTPQPVGALFDYILDDSDKFIPERAGLLKQEVGKTTIAF